MYMHCFLARAIFPAMAGLLTTMPSVMAEKPDMSVEELHRTATYIVTGEVTGVYHRSGRVTTHCTGTYDHTNYVAEVRVIDCEKGCGIQGIPSDFPSIAKDSLIYVRYWRRAWAGEGLPPPTTGGHRGLPTEGESYRIYLVRNGYDGFTYDNTDGGFNVIGANGFEKLALESDKGGPTESDAAAEPPPAASVADATEPMNPETESEARVDPGDR